MKSHLSSIKTLFYVGDVDLLGREGFKHVF